MIEDQIALLILAARGLTNKQIAEELELSERTIKNHFSILYKSLGAKNRTHAVVIALKREIIIQDDNSGEYRMNDFDKERLALLKREIIIKDSGEGITIQFNTPRSIQEADALDWFSRLPPGQRTELLAAWYHEDQQRELARVEG